MKYEKLTNYIPLLLNDDVGEWIIDTENDGSPEHPLHFPFVSYSETIYEFIKAVHDFSDDNPELELYHYSNILERNGIKLSKDIDVSKLDGACVAALLMAVVRGERFCDGMIKSYIDYGAVQKWLKRLKEIDEN